MVMAGLKQRRKRVSWARDGNLCKVRLFLSEDAPSQSGFGAQDHLQAKAAWLLHTAGVVDSNDCLPPGFEKSHKHQPRIEISQIPIIKWQRPPLLVVNPEWLVVAGEESQDVAIENQRHLGVLEAIYPRPYSIPPNPAFALDAQQATVCDSQTPLIPITAIEDEDTTEESDAASSSNCALVQSQGHTVAASPQHIPQDLRYSVQQPQPNEAPQIPNLSRVETPPMATTMEMVMAGMAPGAEPDILAAASAVFTAIMKTCEEGSLVDRDLLVKILSNPVMIERLATEYGGPKQIAQLKQDPLASTPQPVAATSAGAPPKHGSLPPTSAGAPPLHVSLPPASQHVAATSAGAPPHHVSLPRVSQHVAAATTAGAPPLPLASQHVATTLAAAMPQSAPPGHTQISAITPLSAPAPHSFQLPNMITPSTLNAHHSPGQMPAIPPPAKAPPVKDVNYYKSLIELHGGEKQEAFDQKPFQFKNAGGHQFSSSGSLQQDYHNNMMGPNSMVVEAFGHGGAQKQSDVKPKVSKPCVYFNTPRGCRHGASCLFQHDGSTPHLAFEQQKDSAKRIKLDRDIGGSN
ncbi:zinc finger CCCH domain-containing protein 30 [Iris pallida]|uniref:Zinc finger CCCH domain-containing protein 30 n=1 Tax=Iris pallida TaxID=29817 RepID=A0AAX6GD32_IRIPA|nr:zinc finger CCCH domain-containing protein 30 [Iris pallida]